jgi:hypothetical protein
MNRDDRSRLPFWSYRPFRWLLAVNVIGVSILAVLVFEILPKQKALKTRNSSIAPAWVPSEAAGSGRVPFEGELTKAVDGAPIEEGGEPYAYLIRTLHGVSAETLRTGARYADHSRIVNEATKARGTTFRIMAMYLGDSGPIRVDGRPGGVEFVYRTYLMDTTGGEGYVVDLLQPLPADVRRKDLLMMDAVFLRLASYEGGRGVVRAPLFVGREATRIPSMRFSDMSGMVLAVVVVMICASAFFTVRLVRVGRMPKPPGPPGPFPPGPLA